MDVIYLWERGEGLQAVTTILITLVVGLGAAVAGVGIGRSFA